MPRRKAERTFTTDTLVACVGVSHSQFVDRHARLIPGAEIVEGRPVRYRPGALGSILARLRSDARCKVARPDEPCDNRGTSSPAVERGRPGRTQMFDMDNLHRSAAPSITQKLDAAHARKARG